MDVTRTIMSHMHVPKYLLSDAVLTATYLINRMPSGPLGGEVPIRRLKPNTCLFPLTPRVFCCVAFVQDLSSGLDKLSPRSIKCIFVGYSRTQKGYRCFHPPTRWYFVSADVTFFESMHYSDASPTPVESVPHPSMVERQDVVSPESSIVHPQVLQVDHPLQVYRRRQSTPTPLTTKSDSSAAANPPPSPSDIPIALRKGSRSSTAHLISNFVSYPSLHSRFRSFALSLSS